MSVKRSIDEVDELEDSSENNKVAKTNSIIYLPNPEGKNNAWEVFDDEVEENPEGYSVGNIVRFEQSSQGAEYYKVVLDTEGKKTLEQTEPPEEEDEYLYGGKTKKSNKSKRSKKSNKSNKTKKSRKSKKARKSKHTKKSQKSKK
jgi:hypothetical protein